MAHPRMYDDDDPVLARVRALCAALPETVEKEAWGRPTFRAGKMYAVLGSRDRSETLVFKPDPDEAPALAEDDRFYPPPYFGPFGWLALDLTPDVDWDEVAELLAYSYRQVAPKRLVALLDEQWSRDGGSDA